MERSGDKRVMGGETKVKEDVRGKRRRRERRGDIECRLWAKCELLESACIGNLRKRVSGT